MSSEIDIQVERMWQSTTEAAKRCQSAYRGFLTRLHIFADLIDHDADVILCEAFGNTDKRKTEESIGLWINGVEAGWKLRAKRRIEQAEHDKRRTELLSKLNLTEEELGLLGIEK